MEKITKDQLIEAGFKKIVSESGSNLTELKISDTLSIRSQIHDSNGRVGQLSLYNSDTNMYSYESLHFSIEGMHRQEPNIKQDVVILALEGTKEKTPGNMSTNISRTYTKTERGYSDDRGITYTKEQVMSDLTKGYLKVTQYDTV